MTQVQTDGAISVSLDPRLRVTGVQVHSVELLRDPARLEEAVAAAYTAALSAQLPPETAAPALAQLRPRRHTLTVRKPTPELLDRHEIRVRDHLEPRTPRPHEVTGRSDNECVSVTLPVTGGRGRLQVDPGWLQQTNGTRLGAAITEAYAAAYARRDS
jgi:DNA-binding protein YbaB